MRANIQMIRAKIPSARFLIPSKNIAQDSAQWPSAAELGAVFINSEPFPSRIRWWNRARRFWPKLDNNPPAYHVSTETIEHLRNSDIVIMTGGDIISLDYGLESLYFWTRICESAMNAGKPTVLWAGSVGPFSRQPLTEARMTEFLKRFALITVRESTSLEYLKNIGIGNVKLVADPAFLLEMEPIPIDLFATLPTDIPMLGFNVSPLIQKFLDRNQGRSNFDDEIADFLVSTLQRRPMNILLIPHVDPLGGASENSDSSYMTGILTKVRSRGFGPERIGILPRKLNAAQLKAAIGKCRFFIGARTHATIAALSQCIPTISIAYSVKAKGINHDLFGHLRFVLNTPTVSAASLDEHLELLIADEIAIVGMLRERLPEWKRRAAMSAEYLEDLTVVGIEARK